MRDRLLLVDFGLARTIGKQGLFSSALTELTSRFSDGERLTQVGAIAGTRGYMCPEQVCGIDADARSDQFSFCAALYEALYGQLPLADQTFEEYAADILAGRMHPPCDVPIAVEQAIRRSLSTEPAARFASMQELITAMESGLDPDSESPSTRRVHRRFRLLVALIILVTMVSGVRHRFASIDRHLSAAVRLVGFILLGLVTVLFFLCKTLLRRTSHRRTAYFSLVLVFYMFSSRIFASAQGIKLSHYVPLELLGMGALLVADAPHSTPKYHWLAAICYAYSWLVFFVPKLPIVFVHMLYLGQPLRACGVRKVCANSARAARTTGLRLLPEISTLAPCETTTACQRAIHWHLVCFHPVRACFLDQGASNAGQCKRATHQAKE